MFVNDGKGKYVNVGTPQTASEEAESTNATEKDFINTLYRTISHFKEKGADVSNLEAFFKQTTGTTFEAFKAVTGLKEVLEEEAEFKKNFYASMERMPGTDEEAISTSPIIPDEVLPKTSDKVVNTPGYWEHPTYKSMLSSAVVSYLVKHDPCATSANIDEYSREYSRTMNALHHPMTEGIYARIASEINAVRVMYATGYDTVEFDPKLIVNNIIMPDSITSFVVHLITHSFTAYLTSKYEWDNNPPCIDDNGQIIINPGVDVDKWIAIQQQGTAFVHGHEPLMGVSYLSSACIVRRTAW